MDALGWAAALFFYGYAAMLVVAGVWGALAARRDHRLLMGVRLELLAPAAAASMLSQYRYMRTLEAGFGGFALVFRREVFTVPAFNRLFLLTILLGVGTRLLSLARDGRPRRVFYYFLAMEALAVIVIYLHTRRTLGAP